MHSLWSSQYCWIFAQKIHFKLVNIDYLGIVWCGGTHGSVLTWNSQNIGSSIQKYGDIFPDSESSFPAHYPVHLNAGHRGFTFCPDCIHKYNCWIFSSILTSHCLKEQGAGAYFSSSWIRTMSAETGLSIQLFSHTSPFCLLLCLSETVCRLCLISVLVRRRKLVWVLPSKRFSGLESIPLVSLPYLQEVCLSEVL